jgi:hypothetical protein
MLISERRSVTSAGDGGIVSGDPALTVATMPIPSGDADAGGYRVRK